MCIRSARAQTQIQPPLRLCRTCVGGADRDPDLDEGTPALLAVTKEHKRHPLLTTTYQSLMAGVFKLHTL